MNSVPRYEDVMLVTREVSGPAALEDPEAKGLYECCLQVPEDGLVVEVGCQLGRSSSLIAQVGKAIGFHTIHIDPYTSQPEFMKLWMEMMCRVGGDFSHAFTLFCMRTDQAKWWLSNFGRIDLAFIDGDHEECAVEVDLALVANKVKKGGLLAAHDYDNPGLPGVKAALDKYTTHFSDVWRKVGVFGSLGVWERIYG